MKKIKVIYIYTDGTKNYKIGKADERLDSNAADAYEVGINRIKEQLTAGTYGKHRIIECIDITECNESSTFIEGRIHSYLEHELGFERLYREIESNNNPIHKGSSEWFNITGKNKKVSDAQVVSYVQDAIKKYTGKNAKKSYTLRKTQQEKKNDFFNIIKKHGSKVDILEDLCPRFGKTIFTIDQFKTLNEQYNKKILLLPAYVLTAHSSFEDEINTFKEFNNMICTSNDSDDFEEIINNNYGKKPIVALLSLHVPNWKDKYKFISELPSEDKVLVVDEADYGAHTSGNRDIIEYLNTDTRVFMTGTAAERAINGLDIAGVVSCSYTELLLNEQGGLIDPLFYTWKIPNAASIQEQLPPDFQGKWSKIFADIDKSEKLLTTLIKALYLGEYEFSDIELSSLTHHNTDVSMIFSGCRNKAAHSKFAKIVKKTLGSRYEVIILDGDHNITNKDAQKKTKSTIAKARNKGKKVIILSMDMGSRSYSVSEIDTVFLMFDGGMESQVKQKISRVLTPGKLMDGDNKGAGIIIDLSFDSNRTQLTPIDLFIVSEAIKFSKEEETLQESIKRICNVYPIFVNDIHEILQLDTDKYAEDLLQSSNLLDVAASTINIENLLLSNNEGVLEILQSLDEDEIKSIMTKVKIKGKSKLNISKVKTLLEDKEGKEINKEDKDTTLEIIYAAIASVVYNVVKLNILSRGGTNIVDILDKLENNNMDNAVKLNMGLDIDTIKHLVDKNVLPIKLINTALESYNKKEKNSLFSLTS